MEYYFTFNKFLESKCNEIYAGRQEINVSDQYYEWLSGLTTEALVEFGEEYGVMLMTELAKKK